MQKRVLLLALLALLLAAAVAVRAQAPVRPVMTKPSATFNSAVRPLLENVCAECHYDRTPLNIALFTDPSSFVSQREGWEKIVARVRAGEMSPSTVDQPSDADINAFLGLVEPELERLDRLAKPDPGRVTAHRLNRAEYANTVRDLLGVDFRASDEFPADD